VLDDPEALARDRHRLTPRRNGGPKISAIPPGRARRRAELFAAAHTSRPANDNGAVA
jgi:hypothetical protein